METVTLRKTPTAHVLKTWPEYFQQVARGQKPFEIRKADRDFQPDDGLILAEFDPASQSFTGQKVVATIGFVLREFEGLQPGYAILGLTNVSRML